MMKILMIETKLNQHVLLNMEKNIIHRLMNVKKELRIPV